MTRIKQGLFTVLNAMNANGVGTALDVSDYKTVVFQLATSGSTQATIKFAASMSLKQPNFNQPPSPTNVYDYVQVAWLNNDSSVPGETGIVLSGTDLVRLYEVNTNLIKWLCPIVSGYAAGSINCELDAANNYTR